MFFSAGELREEAKMGFWASDGFEKKWLNLSECVADVLLTADPFETIRFQARGPRLILRFHVHEWSGAVYFETGGQSTHVDLYAAEHGFRDFEIPADESGHINLVVRTGAPPNRKAKGNQVWFVGATFFDIQDWRPRSVNISEYARLTYGEHGAYLTLPNDAVIGASICETGVWASKDVEFFKSVVKPGMVVLDIGANIGHHTVLYSKLVGSDGFVLGFEPQRLVARVANANLTINGCVNGDVLQTALGDDKGVVNMYPVDYNTITNFGALGVDQTTENVEDRKGEAVPVTTLDSVILDDYPHLKRVDFMKIDVQSYELFVLRGATEVIKRFKPSIFLEISPHWMKLAGYQHTEIYDFLRSFGYVFDHLDGTEVSADAVKKWSGREGEEWDVFARYDAPYA